MLSFLCEGHSPPRSPRSNLWAKMGTGKTSVVLTYLHYLHVSLGEKRPSLVLAPLRVATMVWPAEVAKWRHLKGLRVVAVVGDAEARRRALRTPADVYVTNYDNLLWLKLELEGQPWPFGRCIADEATRLKNFRITQGGARAQSLGSVAHKEMSGWVNLTGTPAPNGLADLWGQQWFVDGGRRLGASYSAFEARWFAWKRKVLPDGTVDRYASNRITLPHSQEEISDLLADCTLSAEIPGLPEPVFTRREVELPASARAHYKRLRSDMFLELRSRLRDQGEEQDVDLEVFCAGALTMKCLQLASGAMYLDPLRYEVGTWIEVHEAKIAELESVIEEANGMPVLVAYQWQSDVARLRKHFPQGQVMGTDPALKDEWNAGRVPLLFIHPASAGHGLSLQDGGNIIVFFSHWWDLELRLQVIERIGPARQLMSGHDRAVHVIDLVAKDTIDELVMLRHTLKVSVQELLFQSMKDDG
ncbi:MAG: hypothetical protein RLZZ524_442 [Pseudomonadota bacterium]|jgi:SNF2 family DNA or RNA helicase